jgi:hypothetical protein
MGRFGLLYQFTNPAFSNQRDNAQQTTATPCHSRPQETAKPWTGAGAGASSSSSFSGDMDLRALFPAVHVDRFTDPRACRTQWMELKGAAKDVAHSQVKKANTNPWPAIALVDPRISICKYSATDGPWPQCCCY